MLTSTTSVMRFGAAGTRGLQLQATALGRTACSYSSLAALAQRHALPKASSTTCSNAKSALRRSPVTSRCQFVIRRHNSTTASAASTSSSSASPSTPAALDWNTFFQLRKSRRRFQLVCSFATMFLGASGGALLITSVDMDKVVGQIPLDPFVTLGLITLSTAGLGWLAGPSLGNAIFYMMRSKFKAPMELKEVEFFARIKKHRVDPSTSSAGNPVPDFYGEKISSVTGYRQWLKDQRAYNRKRTNFI